MESGGPGKEKLCTRRHWNASEDAELRELVAIYGPQNWNLISSKLNGRSGKSCRLRWCNQLDPNINRSSFTEEEDQRLVEAHKSYGNRWALISRIFPGRTDNAVKNRFHVLMSRNCRSHESNSYTDQPVLGQASHTISTVNPYYPGGESIEVGSPASQILFSAPEADGHREEWNFDLQTTTSPTTAPAFIDFLGTEKSFQLD